MNISEVNIDLLIAILSSSVISVFVTQFFLKLKYDKKIRIKNITQERKEWRDRIREIIVELTEAFDNHDRLMVRKIEAELIVKLNPEDIEDFRIINMFPGLYECWDERELRKLSDRLSYLLKHDWERAKKEVTGGGYSIYKTIHSVLFIVVIIFFLETILNINLDSILKDNFMAQLLIKLTLWLALVFIASLTSHSFKNSILKFTSVKSMLDLDIRMEYRGRPERENTLTINSTQKKYHCICAFSFILILFLITSCLLLWFESM